LLLLLLSRSLWISRISYMYSSSHWAISQW
jgi:hypothetical protein